MKLEKFRKRSTGYELLIEVPEIDDPATQTSLPVVQDEATVETNEETGEQTITPAPQYIALSFGAEPPRKYKQKRDGTEELVTDRDGNPVYELTQEEYEQQIKREAALLVQTEIDRLEEGDPVDGEGEELTVDSPDTVTP